MDAAVATIIGVAIGSLFTLLGNVINNKHLRRQQQEQWDREHKKWTVEQEIKYKEQSREHVQAIYENSVRYVSKMIAGANKSDDFGEFHKWISLLLMYFYDKESTDYRGISSLYADIITGERQSDKTPLLEELRETIVSVAVNDPRIK